MKFLIAIFLVLIICESLNTNPVNETDNNLAREAVKTRLFGVTQTNESLVIKFGDSVILKDPFSSLETNIEWYLNQNDVTLLTIYENNKLNKEYENLVTCYPSEDKCEALEIKNFNKDFVGEFARQSKVDRINFNFYSYLITGYESPLRINCDSNKLYRCDYNASSSSLYVREDENVQIECSAVFWKYSNYESPAVIEINGCTDSPDERKPVGRNFGLYQFEIMSKCKRMFSKTDDKFTCTLKYENQANRVDNSIIDNLEVKLNVEYGPINDHYEASDLNKVTTKGKSVVLKCPITGNPIKYYWKYNSNEISGNKEFTVPNNLAVGSHNYECRAEIDSLNGVKSESIKFKVVVNDVKKLTKKNLIIIICSSVGGVLGVALIIGIIVFILKGKKKDSKEPSIRGRGEPAQQDENTKFRK